VRNRRRADAAADRAAKDLARRLTALIAVVEHGIRLQPDAEETIAECCRPGETPPDVARRGGRIVSEYARLFRLAEDLSVTAGPDSLQVRVAELLMYHTTTVEGCLKLAFSQFWSPKAQRHGHSHTGLGEPARTLRETKVALLMWLAELRSDERDRAELE
jgi:hypothetical protein